MNIVLLLAILLGISVQAKSIDIPLNQHTHPIVGGLVSKPLLRNQTLELYATFYWGSN